MGKRGPKSNAPGGYGYITPKGYRRIWCINEQRFRMEHVVVWESANGPVPDGFEIHHRNENKIDNRLDNLRLVSDLRHKRIHSGCYFDDDGVEWKPCRKCGTHRPIAD